MKTIFTLTFTVFLITNINAQNIGDCSGPTAIDSLDINNVKSKLLNGGDLWWNLNSAGYQVPYENDTTSYPKNTIFAGAIWMGGIDDNNQLKVSQQTYRQNGHSFWPGPIDNNTASTDSVSCINYDKIWKVNKSTIDLFNSGGTLNTEQEEEIYSWPGKGNPNLSFTIDQDMAPFVDIDLDNIYNPDNGDYPLIKGDQACWWVINDIGNQREEFYMGSPLSMEIKVMAFAYNSEPQFDNSTFYEFELTNKSAGNYTDFLFAIWADLDLGGFWDDFIGCDPETGLGYVYNSTDFDAGPDGYGDEIPVQGIQFVSIPDSTYDSDHIINSFAYYSNDFSDFGNPESGDEYYNYLTANWKNGNPITYGKNGTDSLNAATNYMYPSSPDDCSPGAWSQCNFDDDCELTFGSDQRILMSVGKYNFAVGETKTFLIAAHTVLNVPHPCPTIEPLLSLADSTANFFRVANLTDIEVFENTIQAVKVYPNPSNDKIYIEGDIEISSIQIINIAGQIVKELNMVQNSIDVNDLVTGNYLLKVSFKNGNFGQQKISIIK